MKTIRKFPLSQVPSVPVAMPAGSTIIAIQTQSLGPCIWAEVDTSQPMVTRTFAIVGTGHELPPMPYTYIGTFQIYEGSLVFHVYEVYS